MIHGRAIRPKRSHGTWLILVVCGVAVVYGTIKASYYVFPLRFHRIDESEVYRGALQKDRVFKKIIEDHAFKTVVSLTGEIESQREIAEAAGARYLVYHWRGGGFGPFEEYQEVGRILADPSSSPVFFHCVGGDHRSNAATFSYLLEKGASVEEALDRLEEYDFDAAEERMLGDHLHAYAEWRGQQDLSGSDVQPSVHGNELESTPFMFVSWADTKLGKDVLSGVSDQAVLLDPAFSIFPGDLEDWGFTQGGMDQWKEAVDGGLTGDTAPNGMSDIVFAVRGNHDAVDTSGWQAYFDFQATAHHVGATHYTHMPGEEDLTYSFDYQHAHFIGVDVPGDASKITSTQIQWIDAGLADAEARGLTHAFIYFHGPIYCVGQHCSCSGRVCSVDSSVQDLIDVLNRHPIVSATFHGHEHTYAYTYIDETRIPPDGSFEGVTHPFRQLISASAGAETRRCNANRCDYNMPEPGFVTVEVDGPNVTVTFYQRASLDPVNTIRFVKEGVATP